PGCYDPMPLCSYPRPPVIPPTHDLEKDVGVFFVSDVYQGTYMEGIPRGSIKSLRVVESPEKRFWTHPSWQGQGTIAPAMNWHDFNNKRILGTVPVEKDGSAHFSVPANKFVYFQLLDDRGMMVQSMRSGTILQPGETIGCVGCHDHQHSAPAVKEAGPPLALRRPPDELEGWYGESRLFSYQKEVQPVFDKHCVSCHDYGKEEGDRLNLSGDRTLTFNTSYNELWRKGYLDVVVAGPSGTQPPYSWGSHASLLVKVLLEGHEEHENLNLSNEDFDRIVTWIDLNAPYYPHYSSAYPENPGGRSPLNNAQIQRLEELTGVTFSESLNHTANRGPLINFDRPTLSHVLERIDEKDSKEYAESLAIIKEGQANLERQPRADMDGFRPSPVDELRQEKYQSRHQVEMLNRTSIVRGAKRYDWD
ncbi:MAG: hypothetical protein KC940_26205, partial [Candidatus Omnitrophica bacterium]|nr:hypothetical protein [Candidatus Omnitrophota bacterium]